MFLAFLALVLALSLLVVVPPRLRAARRARLFADPMPRRHVEILERNVPRYRDMPADLKAQLHGHINVFLDEKAFAGCGGLEITDEIAITIAGHACMLLLNRGGNYFPGFSSILVYPGAYLADEVTYDGPVEVRGRDARSGESWQRGPVVLSWEDVLDGLREDSDGYNVVLHEFAHKLDEENGDMDGVPRLEDSAHYREWADVLSRAYETQENPSDDGSPVLDDYAFSAPEEFFAVATESFFEKSASMKRALPRLYEQLERFYRVDPAAWRSAS